MSVPQIFDLNLEMANVSGIKMIFLFGKHKNLLEYQKKRFW